MKHATAAALAASLLLAGATYAQAQEMNGGTNSTLPDTSIPDTQLPPANPGQEQLQDQSLSNQPTSQTHPLGNELNMPQGTTGSPDDLSQVPSDNPLGTGGHDALPAPQPPGALPGGQTPEPGGPLGSPGMGSSGSLGGGSSSGGLR